MLIINRKILILGSNPVDILLILLIILINPIHSPFPETPTRQRSDLSLSSVAKCSVTANIIIIVVHRHFHLLQPLSLYTSHDGLQTCTRVHSKAESTWTVRTQCPSSSWRGISCREGCNSHLLCNLQSCRHSERFARISIRALAGPQDAAVCAVEFSEPHHIYHT